MQTVIRRSFQPTIAKWPVAQLGTIYSGRPYSVPTYPNEPSIQLDYTVSVPLDGNEKEGALVLLHGVFGSKRNFASLCKAFARELGRPVYALDLRNHGSSPHARPMTYDAMSSDVLRFIREKQLQDVSLIGHSMGGKVAMALALSPSCPDTLSHLVVSDIAPVQIGLSSSFVQYLDAMREVEDPASEVHTRIQADKVLTKYEKDVSIRQFLLTNLVLPNASDGSTGTAKFQIPVGLLKESLDEIGSFPYTVEDGRKWYGPTLVTKGARSNYINERNIPILSKFFPDMKLEVLETGHWIHAEKPNEWKKLVENFILGRRT